MVISYLSGGLSETWLGQKQTAEETRDAKVGIRGNMDRVLDHPKTNHLNLGLSQG